MFAWSADDLLAAVTSVDDERARCSGCGLRDDEMSHVEADLRRCPGCEAAERKRKEVTDAKHPEPGIHVAFFPVDDARASVWARYTDAGRRWAAQHRRDDGLLPAPPEADG